MTTYKTRVPHIIHAQGIIDAYLEGAELDESSTFLLTNCAARHDQKLNKTIKQSWFVLELAESIKYHKEQEAKFVTREGVEKVYEIIKNRKAEWSD